MRLTVIAATLFLSGCSASLDDYKQTKPDFVLQEYLSGDITAWGIVQDYSDKLVRRFCVDIKGTWEQEGDVLKGTLDETFYYADGEEQKRIWKLEVDAQGNVTGTAGDVIGTASGRATGTAFNWQYTLDVPVSGSNYELAVDDWMYMMDDTRMMNRSYMSKFGVTVAEISIFFDKTQPIRKCR